MAMTANDVKYYQSTNRLGGQITTTEVVDANLHNIFDRVNKRESLSGEVNYRCIYVKNTHSTDTLYYALVYLVSNTPSATTTMEFGLGTAGLNQTEQTVIDEHTAPIDVVFVENLGELNSQNIGEMPAGSYIAIWLKRTILPNTIAEALDFATLRVEGEIIA